MKRYAIYILALISYFYLGCKREQDQEVLKPNQIRVTPFSLFNEETRSLESVFFKYSTTIKYEYTGTKKSMMLGWEIWQNGEIKEKFDGLAIPANHKGVCCVCLNEFPPEKEEKGYRLSIVASGVSTKGSIYKPELAPDSPDYISWHKLENSFISMDDEEPIFGALCTGKEANLFIGSEDFMDLVKRIEWVAVIKFKFVDKIRY